MTDSTRYGNLSVMTTTEPLLVTAMRRQNPSDHVRTRMTGTTVGGFLREFDEHVTQVGVLARADLQAFLMQPQNVEMLSDFVPLGFEKGKDPYENVAQAARAFINACFDLLNGDL